MQAPFALDGLRRVARVCVFCKQLDGVFHESLLELCRRDAGELALRCHPAVGGNGYITTVCWSAAARHGYEVGQWIPTALAPQISGLLLGDRGLAVLQAGGYLSVGTTVTVASSNPADALSKSGATACGDDGGLRVLHVQYLAGRRLRASAAVVELEQALLLADWLVNGLSTTVFLSEGMAMENTTFVKEHLRWRSRRRVAAADPGMDEYFFSSGLFYQGAMYDQLSRPIFDIYESTARRFHRWEEAAVLEERRKKGEERATARGEDDTVAAAGGTEAAGSGDGTSEGGKNPRARGRRRRRL